MELKNILEKEYENYTVYPPKKDILNAFFLTPYSEVKVVLLGQDPYNKDVDEKMKIFQELDDK